MKPFTFYDIYYTPLQALSDEQAGKFFRKICNCLEGKQTESTGKIPPNLSCIGKALQMILNHTEILRARAADWTSGTDTFRF